MRGSSVCGDGRPSFRLQYNISALQNAAWSYFGVPWRNGLLFHLFTSDAPAESLPYSKTRNRRHRMQVMDCGRSLQVTTFSDDFDFDIAVDLDQPNDHQGREHFGVPQNMRRWLENNPRQSPQDQRKDLMAAIARGELSASKKYLSPTNVFYWRRNRPMGEYPRESSWGNVSTNYAEFRQRRLWTRPNRVGVSYGSCINQWEWICRRSRRFTSIQPSTRLNRTRISMVWRIETTQIPPWYYLCEHN